MPDVLWEIKNRIGYVTVNRAHSANSITKPCVDDFSAAIKACREDDACRAVIITGAGEKAFSAGADVNTFLEEIEKPMGGREWSRYGQAAFNLLDRLGKPTVAAINGLAMGGGFELALACTFRIASQSARLGFTEINLGLLPGWGGHSRLTRLVGKSKAAELLLTGDLIGAEGALAMGLVDKVTAPQNLISECEALLARIIKHSPVAVRVVLEALHYAQYQPLEDSQVLESNLGGLACGSAEAQAALKAFIDKRKGGAKG